MSGGVTMNPGEDMSAFKARLITDHVCSQLSLRSSATKEGGSNNGGTASGRPLFVGMQGPQGSGKTTVTSMVADRLKAKGIQPVVLSVDDLYLTHAKLVELAQRHPDNKLLQGRGQPGTHDMQLGSEVLRSLSKINDASADAVVQLPIFDKSLHAGEGDRSKETVSVSAPIDVVILEGWCLGFLAISPDALERRYKENTGPDSADVSRKLPYFTNHSLTSLLEINERLKAYKEWYNYLDAFVQLVPKDLHDVFAWRLQAEHAMKASGKQGMTDEQVHDFVARYMPGYELFGEGVIASDTPWSGRGMALTIDVNRDVLSVQKF